MYLQPMRARHTSTQSDLQCATRAGREPGGLLYKRPPSVASPGAPQCSLVSAPVNLECPKEPCWSSAEQARPCAASARKARLANGLETWRNVGLGVRANAAADTTRSFSILLRCLRMLARARHHRDRVACTTWVPSHTIKSGLRCRRCTRFLIFADPIHRFTTDPDVLPDHLCTDENDRGVLGTWALDSDLPSRFDSRTGRESCRMDEDLCRR